MITYIEPNIKGQGEEVDSAPQGVFTAHVVEDPDRPTSG